MRTLQQNSHRRIFWPALLLTLSLLILFSCSQPALAQATQQKDGEETTNTFTPSGRVNFNIIQLLNGDYLDIYGTGTSHGILRGHPSVSAIELGSVSADPLIFSTNSVERMRIMSNGFIGIGTNNPITPFELHSPDTSPYSVGFASTSRMRLVNNNTTNNNAVELNLSTVDTSGVVATGVRLVGIFSNHTAGSASADFAMVLRNNGNWFEVARYAAGGNVGFGTNAPAYKLDVAGPIRSSSGGFVFPDGTVQTTAGGGGGGGSQWVTNGTSVYYNGGNVGVGTTTPGVALDVAQEKAIRVGNAVLSSGGDYVHLGNHTWFGGNTWQWDGQPGALYQIQGQNHAWYTHNAVSFTNLMYLRSDGFLGVGTSNPTSRLHVNGGSIRLASTAGETPFQLYSYANSTSLWFTSGNPNTSELELSPGYAVDYDRSLAVQYTPGTTGAAAGVLNIGQLYKNNANWTHGTTAFYTSGTERVRINSAGNVGIGTTSPAYKLDVAGQIRSSSGGIVFPDGTVQTTAGGGGGSSQWTTSGTNIFYNNGNVGIGTTAPTEKLEVTGNIKVSGNINAKYQDVAEWVESSQELPAGTVVILDASKSNHVIASTQSYDSRVAGVISLKPGLTLGEEGEGRVLVATTGRVKVKVDATNGPVQIGDLLVTSDHEGFAMKSLPIEIGGARMHRPGTLIGKALEPLQSGTGEILVLLSLQ